MELTDYRDRFPILAETTYLINHSLGAMPAEAAVRLQRYADEWATRGARAWGEGWWETPITVGDQIGRIVGAPPRPSSSRASTSRRPATGSSSRLGCFRRCATSSGPPDASARRWSSARTPR